MRKKLLVAATLALGAAANAAVCVLTPSGAVGGAPTGVSKVSFNNLAAGVPGAPFPGGVAVGPNGTITVSRTGDGGVVQTENPVISAAPFLSGGNGAGFGPGGTNQANGDDATPYLTTGTGTPGTPGANSPNTVTLLFPGPQLYMGLLWGSVDASNTLTFYNGANLVGTVTGAQVANAGGDQGVNGTLYVNITSTCPFDRVVASSGFTSFEFDNVAYNAVPPCDRTQCVYTQGYWKNHEEVWTRFAPVRLGTNPGVLYTQAQLLSIFRTPVKGNGLISLAHQLIAAKLNIANGACAPQSVLEAIAAADALIGNLVVPPIGSGHAATSLTSTLNGILDQYNNGNTPGGPAHCD